MTFWQFFNESPVVGLLFSVVAIFAATSFAEHVVTAIATVLRAKITGAVCDCVPCTHPDHDTDEEPEGQDP